jgi:cytochrome c2
MTYDESGVPALGNNPGKWSGSTVEWDTQVPWGTTVGPFIIVTEAQGATTPPNVAQISFSWKDLGGNTQDSTAVSAKVTPVVPTPVPTARRVAKATPAAAASAAKPTATATTQPAATTQATAAPTTAVEATATPAPTTAPTATTAPAAAAPTGNVAAGQQLFATGTCIACHTINGTGGKVGPDLTHIGSTPYDSVGNDPATLNAWLHDPAAVKPDAKMPKPTLTDAQINDLVAYLTSLK